MLSDSVYAAILERVYEGAFDPAGPRAALEAIRKHFRADHALIFETERSHWTAMAGIDEVDFARFIEPGSLAYATDVAETCHGSARLLLRQEMFPDDRAFEASDAYQHVIRPIGGYNGITLIEPEGFHLAICRGRRAVFDMASKTAFSRLQGHVTSAWRLSRRFASAQRFEAGSLQRLIDGSDDAILLVDRVGCLVAANKEAALILDEATVLQLESRGRLKAADEISTRALQEALVRTGRPDATEPSWLALTDAEGRPTIAKIMPFDPGAYGFDVSLTGVRAAVFLPLGDGGREINCAVLADLFGLTAREIEVCLEVVKGHAPHVIAGMLGLSVTTVRTHLSRAFAKTSTASQRELSDLLRRLDGRRGLVG